MAHGPIVPAGEKETGRLEAFSDGIFAIAMTLLVLDLKVPKQTELRGRLSLALAREWPTFLAYFTSFATILVMWVNHHILFGRIRRVDQPFLFLNGFLLFFVTFVPFPTSLVAEYLGHPEERTPGLVYAGTYVLLAIVFNLLWWYASRRGRLIDEHIPAVRIREITVQYLLGAPFYLVAFGLAFVSVPASVGLCLLLAVYFAFTGTLSRFLPRLQAEKDSKS